MMTATLAGHTWPLTPEQRAVLQQGLAPRTLRLELDVAVDAVTVQAALARVLRRHEVLAHAFGQAEGYRGWRQQPGDVQPALQGMDPRVVSLPGGGTSLSLSVSPLVADAGSLRWLARELAHACLGRRGDGGGSTPALPDEVFQYDQFIAWRQDLAEGEEAHAGLATWTACLHEHALHEAPRFAWRREGHASGSPQANWHASRSVDADLLTRVRTVSERAGVQPEAVVQAGWWSFLARLSGVTTLVGGWRHDCRQDYEVMAGALGVFDKVLPVFTAWPSELSFIDGVSSLSRQLAQHVESQEYWPVDDLPTRAHLSVGFSWSDAGACEGDGWRLVDEAQAIAQANEGFDVALHMALADTAGTLTVSTGAQGHAPEAAAVLAEQFLVWLRACVERPEATVSDLARASGALGAFQGAGTPLLGEALDIGPGTLLDRLAHWAQATPDAPALSCRGEALSHGSLLTRVEQLAGWMTTQGAGPGTLVAVNLPRSIDGVVAMLAAWRAGAGWLPLEPDWPEARRQAVLADARPALVIDSSLDALPIGHAVVPLPTVSLSPSDVAYVLYTSGSTGTPKGVVVEHGALLNYVAASSQAMGLDRAQRWALTGTVAADLGHTALFGALYSGACLVVAEAADMAEPQAFSRFLARERIDAVKMVPSHLEALLDGEAPVVPRWVVLGGEAASASLVEQLARLSPAVSIHNHYGPTETTVGVMVHALDASACRTWPGGVPPLSQVLANGRVHVLDPETLAPVPIGALGELCVGGPQLCRGYLNRDAGDRFVPDPWQPGQRLYRTGDLACLLPEGGLRLAGRLDHQLKIRGFRVEPAEIEAALLGLEGIRQAVVMAIAPSSELVAFVVAATDAGLDEAQVRARLADLLPAHMRPTRCVFLTELPRLANGKVDRLALAALPTTPITSAKPAARAPVDDLEFVLLKGMAALLGSDLGPEDDFFEAGGHSLQVIKLVARVRKQLKLEVAPGLVFDHPTAAALALALRAQATDPAQLDRLASLQRQLAEMSPEQRAALEQQARQQARQNDGAALTGG